MAGVLCALAGMGGGSVIMTVGSTFVTPIKTTYYVDGYVGAASKAAQVDFFFVSDLGALAPAGFSGATVVSLYWASTSGHATNGYVAIEFTGNRAAGFINSVTVDGVSLGTPGLPTYYSTQNTTEFGLGFGTQNNPFGTSGTKTIVIT